jgi:hypothetical protein
MPKRTRTRKRRHRLREPLSLQQRVALMVGAAIGSNVQLFQDDLIAAFTGESWDDISLGIVLAMRGVHDGPDPRADEFYDSDFDPPEPKKVGPQ